MRHLEGENYSLYSIYATTSQNITTVFGFYQTKEELFLIIFSASSVLKRISV